MKGTLSVQPIEFLFAIWTPQSVKDIRSRYRVHSKLRPIKFSPDHIKKSISQ